MPELSTILPGLLPVALRDAHDADVEPYPAPPLLVGYDVIGVRPKNFISTAVPKAQGDSWTAQEIENMTSAIESCFATGKQVIIGDVQEERSVTKINRSIRPAGNDNSISPANKQHRVIDIWGQIVAAGNKEDYSEMLSQDRVRGAQATITFSGGNTINWTAHKRPIGASITFINNGNTLPVALLLSELTDDATGANAWDEYYVSADSYAANTFRIAATRAAAIAGTGTIAFTGTGTGTHKASYGAIHGHLIDTDIFPVPTSPYYVMLDLGNCRESTIRGNFALTADDISGGYSQMCGLGVSGRLDMLASAGASRSVFGFHAAFSQLGIGWMSTPQYDSEVNDHLSDLMVGNPVDLINIGQTVAIPFVAAGNSSDAVNIRRLVCAMGVGARSYISGSHINLHTCYLSGRSDADYFIEAKNAGFVCSEMYVEGQQEIGVDALDAVIKKHDRCSIIISAFKLGGGPDSTLTKGVVYDVSDDGLCELAFEEKSIANLTRAATLRTVSSGARRYYHVRWPGPEGTAGSGYLPFEFEAAGGVTSTNDELLSSSGTDALSKWTWAGSLRKKQLALWDTAVTV